MTFSTALLAPKQSKAGAIRRARISFLHGRPRNSLPWKQLSESSASGLELLENRVSVLGNKVAASAASLTSTIEMVKIHGQGQLQD